MSRKGRKSVALRLAEHFGWDIADMREYDYHAGDYSPKVYAGMDGTHYWSAGPRPPKHKGTVDPDMKWTRVESSHPDRDTLWRGEYQVGRLT